MELKGTHLAGLLVADQALELRTTASVTLQPGYGTLASPALEADPLGNASVPGGLTAGSLSLGGSDVATTLASKALAADLTAGLADRYTKS